MDWIVVVEVRGGGLFELIEGCRGLVVRVSAYGGVEGLNNGSDIVNGGAEMRLLW